MEFRQLGRTRDSIPLVGMGTYGMGSDDDRAIDALRYGLDRGMSLIDTAEMYSSGHSEELVSQAVEGRRESVFVASKVSPSHFAYDERIAFSPEESETPRPQTDGPLPAPLAKPEHTDF